MNVVQNKKEYFITLLEEQSRKAMQRTQIAPIRIKILDYHTIVIICNDEKWLVAIIILFSFTSSGMGYSGVCF
jgi:hypothetical protein